MLDTGHPWLDRRLRSAEFFTVEDAPELLIRAAWVPSADGRRRLSIGMLRLGVVTDAVRIHGGLSCHALDRAVAVLDLRVPRADFGLVRRSRVGPEFRLHVEATLRWTAP